MRERMETNQAPLWDPVVWQLGDSHPLRRSIAVPHETIGTIMSRALEEASLMGHVSEEDAFSPSVLDNWSAYLLTQGEERPLDLEQTLESCSSEHPSHLLFRPKSESYTLRAAPLRLSLEGVEPLSDKELSTQSTSKRRKSKQTLSTPLLALIILLLIACVGILLFLPPKKAADQDASTSSSIQNAASTSEQTSVEPQLSVERAPSELNTTEPIEADGGEAQEERTLPEPAKRSIRKKKVRRKRTRRRKKRRTKRRTQKRRRTRKRRTRKRRNRSKRRRVKRRTRRTTHRRKPPSRR